MIAGARASSPSTPSSPSRARAADVVLAAAAYGEKRGTTTNIEGRVTTVSAEGHAARHQPARLDDRRRARRTARVATSGCRRSTISPRPSPPTSPASPRQRSLRSAAARDGIVCRARCRRPPSGRPRSKSATATTTASSSAASCTTRPRHRQVTVARSPGDGLRAAPAPARPRARRLQRRRRCQGHQQARIDGVQGGRRRVGRPRLGLGAVQPARPQHRRAHRLPPSRSPTCEWRRSDVRARPAARRPHPRRRADRAVEGGRRLRRRRSSPRCSWSGSSARSIADMQNRIGPNRAGPFGILQTLADGIKLFFKEDLIPDTSRPVRVPAGALPVVRAGVPRVVASSRSAATSATATTGIVAMFGHDTRLQLADPPIGVLLLLAVARSRSTASCSPAGRRARSTRCSARCGPRPRWSATRRPSASASPSVHPRRRHAEHQRHRRRPVEPRRNWNLIATGVRAVRDLPDRRARPS